MFQKISKKSKNVKNKRSVEYHVFLSKLLYHSTESQRRGTLVCSRNFRVSKNFVPRRGIYRFSTEKNFCLTVPKAFVGEPFWSVTSFGYRKTLCLTGFSRDILTKCFSLIVPKNIVGETFCVPQNFWYRKTFSITEGGWQGGSLRNYSKILFSLTVLKVFLEDPFCVSESFWYRKSQR